MGVSQQSFVERHRDRWNEFEQMVGGVEKGDDAECVDEFPERYRQICRHLAVARARGYTPGVRDRLEELVERGHTVLYRGHRPGSVRRIWAYAAGGFARDVRRNWKQLVVAVAMLVVPMVAMLAWVVAEPQLAYDILGADQLEQFDAMYGTDDIERDAVVDLSMFANYINNNIGIALRTFGAGIVLGVGSLAILLFNGFYLGTAAGYVTVAGMGEQFWPFVIGHGAFELTAIALAGMAGLKIGAAPLWPGRRGRIEALQKAARDSVGIICGVVVMLVLAAFIEAFWSPRDVEPVVRYVVGAGLWLVVVGYFAAAGRRS